MKKWIKDNWTLLAVEFIAIWLAENAFNVAIATHSVTHLIAWIALTLVAGIMTYMVLNVDTIKEAERILKENKES